MKKAFAIIAALATTPAMAAPKGNAACWGDINRQDITCRAFTDEFLLSLRHATKAEVVKAMGVDGWPFPGESVCKGVPCSDSLHFTSNYTRGARGGSGVVNFLFDKEGRVSVIFGFRDAHGENEKPAQFIWNDDLLPAGCSGAPHTMLQSCDRL